MTNEMFHPDGTVNRKYIRSQLDWISRAKWDRYCGAFSDEEIVLLEKFYEKPLGYIIKYDLAGNLWPLKNLGVDILLVLTTHTYSSYMDLVSNRFENFSEEELRLLGDLAKSMRPEAGE